MSIKTIVCSFLATALLSSTALCSDSLISQVLPNPEETIKGEWIVQSERLLPQKNIDLLDIEDNPIKDNPCVRITLIRQVKGALWIQQVVVQPIKDSEICTKEARKILIPQAR